MDYHSGGAPLNVVFDLNGGGVFDDNDKVPNPIEDDPPIVIVAIPIDGGPGSKPVLGPDNTLFITTPVGGLKPVKVNIPALKIKLNSWNNRKD